MPKFETLEDWIDDAKKQFNDAMDKCKTGKKKVTIRWKHNPQQIVEVEPDVNTEFEAN